MLYNWIVAQKNHLKTGRLLNEDIERLNSIGFIWDKKEFNWHIKANAVKTKLIEHKEVPESVRQNALYNWLKYQLKLLSEGRLPDEKKVIIEEIKILIEQVTKFSYWNEGKIAREYKWAQKFNELLEFRKQNPGRWPQSDSTDKTVKKLGIWCQDLRTRYRDQLLEDDWKNKLLSIGFNFEGHLDNWKVRFEALKTYFSTYQRMPDIKSDIYVWSRTQLKNFNRLNTEQQQLLNSINFLQYRNKIITWETRFAELREFMLRHKKAPTRKSNAQLHKWLLKQRTKYRSGTLSGPRKQALLDLGVDLTPGDKWEANWNLKFEALKKFREENPDRWPRYLGDDKEKKLSIWCQAQRQAFAGTLRNRKDLSQDRIKKLNQIGFRWRKF